MKMRKLGYLFMASFLTLALTACAEKTAVNTEPKETKVNEAENAGSTEQKEWSYEDYTGPEYWGELSSENLVCVNGDEQSPINLEFSQVKVDKMLTENQINYEPTHFTLVNNGHTVQANAITESNSMIVEGNEYKLLQFHFHTPSEHQFNGQSYEMELHLVHSDKNGNLAVLGLMIQEGKENEILASVWGGLPAEETEEGNSEDYLIDLQALLPQNQMSFHYAGSLTTPPCTEEVKWIVFEQPIEMSKEQIQAFQRIFPDNHRPVQPLNDREVNKN